MRRLENEKLKLLIAKLRREQFGQSSERGKLLVEQLELAIENLEESQAAVEAVPDAVKTRPDSQRARSPPAMPPDLPVERIIYPAPCACDRCGGERLRKLDDIVSRTLECEARRWKVIERVRQKVTCHDCEAITETPAPSHPIPPFDLGVRV